MLLSLYALEARLQRARGHREAVRARLTELRREEASARGRLAVAYDVLDRSEHRLGTTLASLYEQGDSDPLAVLFGATTVEDLVNGIDDLERTAQAHASVAAQARVARTRTAALARRLAARAAETRRLELEADAAAASLAASQAERSAYLYRVRAERRAGGVELTRVEAEARAAEARAQEVAAEKAAAPSSASFGVAVPAPRPAPSRSTPPPPASPPVAPPRRPAPAPVATLAEPAPIEAPPSGARTLTVTSTAYASRGSTATGIPVGWGVIAVDPGVIPLGTRMTIPGYGEGVAADVGPGVQGLAVDVWVASEAQAQAWGRRTITITLH